VNQRHKNYFIFFTKVFGWSLSLTLLYFAGNYWGDYEEKSKVKNIEGVQTFPQNSAFPLKESHSLLTSFAKRRSGNPLYLQSNMDNFKIILQFCRDI